MKAQEKYGNFSQEQLFEIIDDREKGLMHHRDNHHKMHKDYWDIKRDMNRMESELEDKKEELAKYKKRSSLKKYYELDRGSGELEFREINPIRVVLDAEWEGRLDKANVREIKKCPENINTMVRILSDSKIKQGDLNNAIRMGNENMEDLFGKIAYAYMKLFGLRACTDYDWIHRKRAECYGDSDCDKVTYWERNAKKNLNDLYDGIVEKL